MERQQAQQKEALVEVMVETDCLESPHRPRGSPADRRGCFKCAVALSTVMGLVILALVAVLIHNFVMFTTASCNQDSHSRNDTARFYIKCSRKKGDEQGRYDILTVNKTATYLIYGEVKNVTSEEVTLWQTWKTSRRIQMKESSEGEIFFLDKVKLISGARISIYFESTSPDSCRFLVYEL